MEEILTNSALETTEDGARIAQILIKKKPQNDQALVIALEGDLGSGKTTFIQGFAEGLGVKEEVLSPTFLILKQFDLDTKNYRNFYHVDAYRLKDEKEILDLGFEDLARDPGNIIVVEWADKIKKILPREIIRIKFENLGGDKRKIAVSN